MRATGLKLRPPQPVYKLQATTLAQQKTVRAVRALANADNMPPI